MKRLFIYLFYSLGPLLVQLNAQQDTDSSKVPQEVRELIKNDNTVDFELMRFKKALNINCAEDPKGIYLLKGVKKRNYTQFKYAYPFICKNGIHYTIVLKYKRFELFDLDDEKTSRPSTLEFEGYIVVTDH